MSFGTPSPEPDLGDLLGEIQDEAGSCGSGHIGDPDWELALSLETTLQLFSEDQIEEDEERFQRIIDVARGRGGFPPGVRGKLWLILLGIERSDQLNQPLDDIYDTKDQALLRMDCQQFLELTLNAESDGDLLPLLESLLTTFIKSSNHGYSKSWLSLLGPLLPLNYSQSELYVSFKTIITNYIPRDVNNKQGLPFHIFRLLLLYHEPELCSLLDTMRIAPSDYSETWFSTLFASEIKSTETIAYLWDVYFQYRDPFLVFHMALVLVLNAKDTIERLKATSPNPKPPSVTLLKSVPESLTPSDLPDLLTLSLHYAQSTPNSYRRMFEFALFGSESYLTFNSKTNSPCRRIAMQSLCLPVSAEELLDSIRNAESSSVRFFLVDCRPYEMYNSGHLPTAFHLDTKLMLSDPVKFQTAIQALLLTQKESISVGALAAGEHLCFLGSGREEEDQYVHMVVSSFLQKNTPKVCLLSGGYQAIHYLLSASLKTSLEDHNESTCPECIISTPPTPTESPPQSQQNFSSKLNQLSSSIKSKSADLKGKLIDYMTKDDPHVKAQDKDRSKPYRNLLDVFKIDMDGNSGSEDPTSVQLDQTLSSTSDFPHVFPCREVTPTGDTTLGQLLLSSTQLVFVREDSKVSIVRPLFSVVKITSKKKHPELITFKYGHTTVDNQTEITSQDRFYLEQGSKEFVAIVKSFITE